MGFISCSLPSVSTFFGILFSISFWFLGSFFVYCVVFGRIFAILLEFLGWLLEVYFVHFEVDLFVFVFLFNKSICLVFLRLDRHFLTSYYGSLSLIIFNAISCVLPSFYICYVWLSFLFFLYCQSFQEDQNFCSKVFCCRMDVFNFQYPLPEIIDFLISKVTIKASWSERLLGVIEMLWIFWVLLI